MAFRVLIKLTRLIFVLLIIPVTSNLFSQPRSDLLKPRTQNFLEKNILPLGDSIDCYISFKIPFNSLFFVLNGGLFNSGLRIDFDVLRDDKIVARKSFTKKITVDTYEKSISENIFLEGVTDFRLSNNNHVIIPTVSFDNTKETIQLDSINILLKRLIQYGFVHPLVVTKIQNPCRKVSSFRLVNNQNNIPFNPGEYSLLIPVVSDSFDEIILRIEQSNNSIFEQKIIKRERGKIIIRECGGIPIVEVNESQINSYFRIDNFSNFLKEGACKIIISFDGKEIFYNMNVVWLQKPKSLLNVEYAIQLLKIIESDAEVDQIIGAKSKDKYEALFDFWNKKLPNRKFAFNDLMNEFYRRADYANENFTSIDNLNGSNTDRGKIYIKFGKPDKINREYDSKNSVIEIWYYEKMNKEFIFVDASGLGNFNLSK